jgi:hypothetical protein
LPTDKEPLLLLPLLYISRGSAILLLVLRFSLFAFIVWLDELGTANGVRSIAHQSTNGSKTEGSGVALNTQATQSNHEWPNIPATVLCCTILKFLSKGVMDEESGRF